MRRRSPKNSGLDFGGDPHPDAELLEKLNYDINMESSKWRLERGKD